MVRLSIKCSSSVDMLRPKIAQFERSVAFHCRLYFANVSDVLACRGLLSLRLVELLLLLILSSGVIGSLFTDPATARGVED